MRRSFTVLWRRFILNTDTFIKCTFIFFLNIGEYATLLEDTGFKITYAIIFDRLTELTGETIKNEAVDMLRSVLYKDMCYIKTASGMLIMSDCG